MLRSRTTVAAQGCIAGIAPPIEDLCVEFGQPYCVCRVVRIWHRGLFFGVKMVTIRCQNGLIGQKNGRCGRILAILTDAMIELLRIDPEKGPLFRCPQCPSEQRWSKITVDKDGKLHFETVDPPENIPAEPEYEDVTIYQQVG